MLVYGLNGLLAELVGRPAASQRRLGPYINDVIGFSIFSLALSFSMQRYHMSRGELSRVVEPSIVDPLQWGFTRTFPRNQDATLK